MKKLCALAWWPLAASAGVYVAAALSNFLVGHWWAGVGYLGVAVIFMSWNSLFRRMAWMIYRQGASDLFAGRMSESRDDLWARVKRHFKGDPLLIVEPKSGAFWTHPPTTAPDPQRSGAREAAEARLWLDPRDSPAAVVRHHPSPALPPPSDRPE